MQINLVSGFKKGRIHPKELGSKSLSSREVNYIKGLWAQKYFRNTMGLNSNIISLPKIP